MLAYLFALLRLRLHHGASGLQIEVGLVVVVVVVVAVICICSGFNDLGARPIEFLGLAVELG